MKLLEETKLIAFKKKKKINHMIGFQVLNEFR